MKSNRGILLISILLVSTVHAQALFPYLPGLPVIFPKSLVGVTADLVTDLTFRPVSY